MATIWAKPRMVWLLPESHFVRRCGTDDLSLVLRVVEGSALCWPAKQVASNMYAVEVDEPALVWHTAFDYNDWEVLPLSPLSPMHMFLHGWFAAPTSVLFGSTSPPVPLLHWQATRGFKGVSEGALRRLADELRLEWHSISIPDGDSSDCIALALMKRVWPELCEGSALSIILQRGCGRDVAAGYIDDLTEDCIYDTVLAKDQKDSAAMLKDYHTKKAARAARVQVTKELVKKAWEKVASAAVQAAKKPTKQQMRSQASSLAASRARWRTQVTRQPHESIQAALPPLARVCIDRVNGRYLCTYPERSRRSISWTVRGEEAAVTSALVVMWRWHRDATGQEPPEHLGLSL